MPQIARCTWAHVALGTVLPPPTAAATGRYKAATGRYPSGPCALYPPLPLCRGRPRHGASESNPILPPPHTAKKKRRGGSPHSRIVCGEPCPTPPPTHPLTAATRPPRCGRWSRFPDGRTDRRRSCLRPPASLPPPVTTPARRRVTHNPRRWAADGRALVDSRPAPVTLSLPSAEARQSRRCFLFISRDNATRRRRRRRHGSRRRPRPLRAPVPSRRAGCDARRCSRCRRRCRRRVQQPRFTRPLLVAP